MAIENINQYTYYQWDIGRVLEVAEEYLSYIFLFQNEGAEKSYVARAVRKTRNSEVYGEVSIPNIIFQQAGNAYVYYCDGIITENEETDEYGNKLITVGNLKTIARQTLFIYRRGKPDNYIYTPEDLVAYDGLSYQVNELKNRSQAMEASIEDHSTCIEDLQATDISLNQRISNIEQHISQDYFFTDDSVVYDKIVPTNACPYAQINSVGGMTYKSEQLLTFPYVDTTITRNGISFTVNEDRSVTANGTATGQGYFVLFKKILPVGTYFLSGTPINSANAIMYAGNNDYSFYKVDAGSGVAFNVETEEVITVAISIPTGETVSNLVFKPMFNEGTKAEPYEMRYEGLRGSKVTKVINHGANLFDKNNPNNFRGGFYSGSNIYNQASNTIYIPCEPNTTYTISKQGNITNSFLRLGTTAELPAVNIPIIDFNAGNDSITSLTLTTSREAKYLLAMITNSSFGSGDIQAVYDSIQINVGSAALPYTPYREPITIHIDEAIQALNGYGLGINAEYNNHIEWRNGRVFYVQKVKSYAYKGTESIFPAGTTNFESNFYFLGISDAKFAENVPCKCNLLEGALSGTSTTYGVGYTWFQSIDTYKRHYMHLPKDITTIEQAKAFLKTQYEKGNPLTVIYALNEPIEADITNLFTEENFIKVEGGGSLEFINNISKPVPSSITYLLKEGSI